MLDYGNSLTVIVVAVLIFFVIFILLREFWCWYFKINERVKLQEKQNELLLKLCKYEKYRMIEENYLSQEDFRFVKWTIDDNLNVKKIEEEKL